MASLKANQKTLEENPILEYFQYAHLQPDLQKVSAPWCRLAWNTARDLPPGAERSVALRKLLEGKDAAVRAALKRT